MEGREVEVRDVTEVGDGTVALDLEAPPEFDA
ncbi:MAG: oxidoreductase, partial [Halobacteria archaeon]|nr:oxidoreductase [Halobacteria archaeon]